MPMLDVFRSDSWYGRLYRRAYGEDRGWIVFLRRLFGVTGFEYPDPPKQPQEIAHTCDGESCVVCEDNHALRNAHAAELTAYTARRTKAYALTLQAIHQPPYRKPFYADAPPANVCPTFWAIVLACVVYVPFVLLPKVAVASALFMVVGAASACVAGVQIVTQHYGRRIATATVGVVVWSATFVATLAMQGGIAAYKVWQPQHAAAIAAAEDLRQDTIAAAPEFAAHGVARAVEEWRFETSAVLADVAMLSYAITTDLEHCRRLMERNRAVLAALDVHRAPSASLLGEIMRVPDIVRAKVWSNPGRQWDIEERIYSVARSDGAFEAIDPSREDAVRDRIAEETEYLLAADFRAVDTFLVASRVLVQAAHQQYERAFVLAAIRGGAERRATPEGLASWMQDRCSKTSDGRWISTVKESSPRWRAIGVPTEYGRYYAYDFPDAACAAVAARFARDLAVGRQQLFASKMHAEQRSLAELQRQRSEFIVTLGRFRADSVVLLLTMEQECGAQWAWEHRDYCVAAAETFSGEISAARRERWWYTNGHGIVSAMQWGGGTLFAIGMVALGLSRGYFHFLGRLLAAFWNVPMIAAFRHGCEWVIEQTCVALGCILAALRTVIVYSIAKPLSLIIRIVVAIGRGIRDTAHLIAAFAKAWYEKRCYQITWQ